MKTVSLKRRRQDREYAIVGGLFFIVFGCWTLKGAVSGQVNDWIGGLWLLCGLSLFVRCWKASAGVHELQWEANRAKIFTDGQVMFDGSILEFKTIVSDQFGYDIHLGTSFIYRLRSVNIEDELRLLLDAACAV